MTPPNGDGMQAQVRGRSFDLRFYDIFYSTIKIPIKAQVEGPSPNLRGSSPTGLKPPCIKHLSNNSGQDFYSGRLI